MVSRKRPATAISTCTVSASVQPDELATAVVGTPDAVDAARLGLVVWVPTFKSKVPAYGVSMR